MKRIVLSLLLCSVALLSLAQKKLYYCEVLYPEIGLH